MYCINRATLLGTVGKDPAIRTMPDGKKVASFSMATNESYKDKSGEKKEITQWHNVVIFNAALISVVESRVKKGTRILVEGNIYTRKYTLNGADRYITEIVLNYDSRLICLDKSGVVEMDSDKPEVEDLDEIPF